MDEVTHVYGIYYYPAAWIKVGIIFNVGNKILNASIPMAQRKYHHHQVEYAYNFAFYFQQLEAHKRRHTCLGENKNREIITGPFGLHTIAHFTCPEAPSHIGLQAILNVEHLL